MLGIVLVIQDVLTGDTPPMLGSDYARQGIDRFDTDCFVMCWKARVQGVWTIGHAAAGERNHELLFGAVGEVPQR